MGQNVAITSLYKGLVPGVNTIANLSMWWPKTGRPWPAEYISIRTGGMCWYLRQQPKGARAMWLNNLLMWEMQGTDPVEWIRYGIPLTKTIRGLTPLSKHLKYAKLPVDLLFCDVEANFSYWAAGKTKVQEILRDGKCRENLPPYIRAIDPFIFDRPSDPGITDAILTWARYAAKFNLDTIKRLLIDTKLFDIPDRNGVIRRPCIVNFSFQQQRWSVKDLNGWPHVNATVDGCSSNPSVYLYTQEWGKFVTDHQHHSLWNRLIKEINLVRASIGFPGHKVFPILDRPMGRHPWVWEQLVAHCIRAGITLNNGQFFLYWNPDQILLDDQIAADVIARHDQAWPLSGPLYRIPYDVDEFETNGFVTRYTDFLEHVVGQGVPETVGAGG